VIGEEITFPSLFVLGFLSCLVPCSIATKAIYVSYIFRAGKSRFEGFFLGVTYTLGASVVFFLIGYAFSYANLVVQGAQLFYEVVGVIFVLFGLYNLGLFKRIMPSTKDHSTHAHCKIPTIRRVKYPYLLEAFFISILLGFGCSPCAIPIIFPVALLVMAQSISPIHGGLLLFTFGLGSNALIIPFCVLSTSAREALSRKLAHTETWTKKVFGIFLILVGIITILYYTGTLSRTLFYMF
jgi:cytochrome c biogenesis protein CcdA